MNVTLIGAQAEQVLSLMKRKENVEDLAKESGY